MKQIGLWLKLLSWHKKQHVHPIFNPEYARENLLCFFESIFMFLVYFYVFLSALKLLSVSGYIEKESLLMLLVYAMSPQNILGRLAENMNPSLEIIFSVIILSILAFFVRETAEVYKAILHPKNK